MKKVIILVGAPGCGKSTRTANYLYLHKAYDPKSTSAVVSADHFFINLDTGQYIFDRSRLHMAHLTCQHEFVDALVDGVGLVIVDNTNTVARDRKFYVDVARSHGYEVWLDVIEADAQTCFARNVHGVPLDAIEKMMARIDVPYGFYKLEEK